MEHSVGLWTKHTAPSWLGKLKTMQGYSSCSTCKVKLKDHYPSTFGGANSPPCNLMLKHANSSHHAKPPSEDPCQHHPRLKHIFTLVSTRLTKKIVSRANKNRVWATRNGAGRTKMGLGEQRLVCGFGCPFLQGFASSSFFCDVTPS